MSWNGCPSCQNCPDRTPYSKCSETCVAYRKWRVKHDEQKRKSEQKRYVYGLLNDHREEMVIRARKHRRDKMN